ncbi:MAG: hypothetical protein ABGZ19_05280 [Verrucomicrobiales bacterium]
MIRRESLSRILADFGAPSITGGCISSAHQKKSPKTKELSLSLLYRLQIEAQPSKTIPRFNGNRALPD